MTKNIPFSLYIHIPWCLRKCPYCDFNSHQTNMTLPEKDYVKCLINDLKHDLQYYQITAPLHSIFIGGGTPSLFSPASIDTLLQQIDQLWAIDKNTEITMEANPGTVEQQNFADYRNAGINRLSLGIQSFCDQKLKILGRIHNGVEALKAIEIAQKSGFDNLNLDVMFGLPQQSIDQGLADLQQAIDLSPMHISWYQLTLEPNTIFYKKPPKLPNQDLMANLQEQGQALLAEHGFVQYEISAYAQNDKQCQHNLNYWQFGDYLGIGAGAHGKITLSQETIIRTRKTKQPNSYLQRENLIAEETYISGKKLVFEYMLNAFRLKQAILLNDFFDKTGLTFNDIKEPLYQASEKVLIAINHDSITKTSLGEKFLNDLLELFL